MWIVVEGDPLEGFTFHHLPEFSNPDKAADWAREHCGISWWVAPLKGVE